MMAPIKYMRMSEIPLDEDVDGPQEKTGEPDQSIAVLDVPTSNTETVQPAVPPCTPPPAIPTDDTPAVPRSKRSPLKFLKSMFCCKWLKSNKWAQKDIYDSEHVELFCDEDDHI